MKRRRFFALTTLSAVFSLGMTVSCTSPTGGDVAGDGEEVKVLVMGTSADYPPYEFYETAGGSGEPIGFDIDIAKALGEKLGYTIEIEDMEFNEIGRAHV